MAQPFVPIPNCVRVEMLYQQDGQHIENVYHVLCAAPPTNQKLQDIANEFIAWEGTTAKPGRHQSVVFLKAVARDLSSQDAAAVETSPAQQIAGLGNGIAMPNNVTLAVKCSSGLSGRSFRGRTYWIGLQQTSATGNTINGATRDAVILMLGTLKANLKANVSVDLCIASKRHNNAWRTVGLATPIQTFTADLTLDSQRRRLPGRGR